MLRRPPSFVCAGSLVTSILTNLPFRCCVDQFTDSCLRRSRRWGVHCGDTSDHTTVCWYSTRQNYLHPNSDQQWPIRIVIMDDLRSTNHISLWLPLFCSHLICSQLPTSTSYRSLLTCLLACLRLLTCFSSLLPSHAMTAVQLTPLQRGFDYTRQFKSEQLFAKRKNSIIVWRTRCCKATQRSVVQSVNVTEGITCVCLFAVYWTLVCILCKILLSSNKSVAYSGASMFCSRQ
jgi:uncharacterized protein (DUF2062 family)